MKNIIKAEDEEKVAPTKNIQNTKSQEFKAKELKYNSREKKEKPVYVKK